jgi:hypothetical protein
LSQSIFPQAPENNIGDISIFLENLRKWCTHCINGTGGKFATGFNYTGCKFATGTGGVVDTGGKFAAGAVDTGGKFAAGVNETDGKLPPAVNLPTVSMTLMGVVANNGNNIRLLTP